VAAAYADTNERQLLALLVEMRYGGTFPFLLELLKSGEAATRQEAIRALGQPGDIRAVSFLIDQLDSDQLLISAEAARVPGKRNAIEPVPQLLERLKNGDRYRPHSRLYRAITQVFQIFSGIRAEIDSTSRGRCPALLEISGFAPDLPGAMSSLGQSHFRQFNQMLSNLEVRVGDLSLGRRTLTSMWRLFTSRCTSTQKRARW